MKTTFWDKYKADIMPVLEEIDLALKLNGGFISVPEAAKLLSLSENEILSISGFASQTYLDKKEFFKVMKNGSSYICKLCARELDCGSPYIYSKEDISYIYDIPLEHIESACLAAKIQIITSSVLPIIFSAIRYESVSA